MNYQRVFYAIKSQQAADCEKIAEPYLSFGILRVSVSPDLRLVGRGFRFDGMLDLQKLAFPVLAMAIRA
jgi:hypothetical protein